MFAPEGSQVTDCIECNPGSADIDQNPWTPCAVCGHGTIPAVIDQVEGLLQYGEFGYLASHPEADRTNATRCHECAPGRYFQVMENGGMDCFACEEGKFNLNTGSVSVQACQPCANGTWAFVKGSARCDPCPTTTFRRGADVGCQPCSNEAYRCNEQGLIFPKAAAGHFVREEIPAYATMDLGQLVQQYYKCTPFEACVGSCTEAELLVDPPDYAACAGTSGELSCAKPYTGDRCSQCKPFDETRGECSDADTEPNGYYRLDQICEPCTCSWFTFGRILMIVFLVTLIIMLVADHWLKEVDHMATVFAPIMIAVRPCKQKA